VTILAAIGFTWQDLYPDELRIEARPRPDVEQLERDYQAGHLRPPKIDLGEVPGDATDDMRRIATDIKLLLGLHKAAGETRPMPYAARFAGRRMGWSHERAGSAIRALVRAEVIDRVGELQPRGGLPRGTALYAPPRVVSLSTARQEDVLQEDKRTWEEKVDTSSCLVDTSSCLGWEAAEGSGPNGSERSSTPRRAALTVSERCRATSRDEGTAMGALDEGGDYELDDYAKDGDERDQPPGSDEWDGQLPDDWSDEELQALIDSERAAAT
jgi:hypothetical protein